MDAGLVAAYAALGFSILAGHDDRRDGCLFRQFAA